MKTNARVSVSNFIIESGNFIPAFGLVQGDFGSVISFEGTFADEMDFSVKKENVLLEMLKCGLIKTLDIHESFSETNSGVATLEFKEDKFVMNTDAREITITEELAIKTIEWSLK